MKTKLNNRKVLQTDIKIRILNPHKNNNHPTKITIKISTPNLQFIHDLKELNKKR